MASIRNLTPHPIVVIRGEEKITIQASGLARLAARTEWVGEIDGIPLSQTKFGLPEGLPDPQDGVYLVVSQLIKSALPQRTDLLVPAEVVRDEKGNIVGCQSLGQ